MTARQLAALIVLRRDILIPALKAVSNDLRIVALRVSKEKMTQGIYAIPEDLNKRGEARRARYETPKRLALGLRFEPKRKDRKWTRTGHLRRSEGARVEDPIRVIVYNKAIYGAARHEAGKKTSALVDKPRNIDPRRECHWQDEMAAELRPLAVAAWREAVRESLQGGSR